MLADERRQAILRAVEQRGAITVKELAEEMGVSAVTLRQDVRELADRGLLARVHGGAPASSEMCIRDSNGSNPVIRVSGTPQRETTGQLRVVTVEATN
ncbi:DeoR family transcriptional regulator, partial [Kitasatospora cineracea]|uniref:DeoR family transcriptional regulator n=1 Tax=Kitasatospora cineracea TaxID=88074 RepID=UPI0036CF5DD5